MVVEKRNYEEKNIQSDLNKSKRLLEKWLSGLKR